MTEEERARCVWHGYCEVLAFTACKHYRKCRKEHEEKRGKETHE